MTKEAFAKKMMEAGVCDERGAAFCATAVKMPNGSFGMCLLGVVGNELSIYETDMKSSVGQKVYIISLKNVTDLTVTNGFFGELFKGYSFRFTYEGFTYTFKNCWQQKAQLAVIQSEAK